MRNKLLDLNNHLFEQLERLNDESLSGDQLISEINRSKAITGVAQTIINNHNTVLESAKFLETNGYSNSLRGETLDILGIEKGESECLEKSKNAYVKIPTHLISGAKTKSH